MQHKDLASGRWYLFDFSTQMANIGSEVERAIKWRAKNQESTATNAHNRAIELFDLTISDSKNINLRDDLAKLRNLWVDYFIDENQYLQTAEMWRNFFRVFNLAARNPLLSK